MKILNTRAKNLIIAGIIIKVIAFILMFFPGFKTSSPRMIDPMSLSYNAYDASVLPIEITITVLVIFILQLILNIVNTKITAGFSAVLSVIPFALYTLYPKYSAVFEIIGGGRADSFEKLGWFTVLLLLANVVLSYMIFRIKKQEGEHYE